MGLSFLNRKKDMSHEQVRELLSEYLDGRLAGDPRTAVARHLEGCSDCSQEMQALRATRQLLQSLPPVRLPRSFTLEVAPRPALLPRGFFWLRSATAVAAAAFVVLLVAPVVAPEAGVPTSRPAASQPAAALSQAKAAGSQPSVQSAPAVGAAEGAPSALAQPAAPAGQAAPAAAPKAAAPMAPLAQSSAPAAAAAPAAAGAAPQGTPSGTGAASPAAAAVPAAPAATTVPSGAAPRQGPTQVAAPFAADAASPAPPQAARAAAPAGPTEAAATRSNLAVETRAVEPAQPSIWSILNSVRTAVGGLVLLLGLATATIWWRHRTR